MIVDPSVFISILLNEEDAEALHQVVQRTLDLRVSAASYLETSIVLDALHQTDISRSLDEFLRSYGIVFEPVTEVQARPARQAYRQFGKGSGHPAKLNFCDCFSYALAIDFDEPLLFKGNDFIHTDVRIAATPAT